MRPRYGFMKPYQPHDINIIISIDEKISDIREKIVVFFHIILIENYKAALLCYIFYNPVWAVLPSIFNFVVLVN